MDASNVQLRPCLHDQQTHDTSNARGVCLVSVHIEVRV